MSRRDQISDFTRPVTRSRYFERRTQSSISRQKLKTDNPLLTNKRNTRLDLDIKRSEVKKPPAAAKQDKSKVLSRKGLKKLPTFQPIKPKKRFTIRNTSAIISMIALIVITPVLFFLAFQENDGVVKGIKNAVSIGNDVPKYLIAGNVMDVPAKIEVVDNIEDSSQALDDNNKLGWYKDSGKPGEKGAMVIVGYVSGSDGTGALKNITSMKKDDFVRLETGDGRIMLFQVVSIEKVLPQEFNTSSITASVIPEKEGLNIVTFTDKFSKNQDLSTYRYIVRTTRQE